MAKIGNKTRQARVYDKEYGETAKSSMPKVGDIALFDSLLQDITMSVLREQIQRFRQDFVERTTDILGQRFKDIVLPPGTRFYRQGKRAVAFAIEVPPAVRTLAFKGEQHSPVAPRDGKWSLALPYLYFFPIFATEGEGTVLSAVCLGCRTEPLESPSDMLYCINLPNVYHLTGVPKKYPEEGIIPCMQQMLICQGYITTRRTQFFCPKSDTYAKMSAEVLVHYWSSRFTGELSAIFAYMQGKFPQEFGSLDVWQENSLRDPLFVLKTEYPPAIRLNKLFDDIMLIHDQEQRGVLGRVSEYVAKIHDEVWQVIRNDEGYQKVRVNLNEAVLAKFTLAIQRFSQALSMNLSSINNDTIKRHVLLAITFALREAVT